ncbi:amidohydrolase [candidate division KSB1 bacterium]|nr:amidohydrolase [candidate division KSB1 bacterium]
MQLFKNANFISCENVNQIHNVLVEDKGKIIFLGDTIPEKFNNIPQHDLNGACVVPAFADTHIHFESFSLFHSTLDTRNASNFDELAALINKYIKDHPNEKVILGFGSSAHTVKEKRLPTLSDLDNITSHPILLIKYDGHAAVANSALLKKLPSSVLNTNGFDRVTGSFFHESFYEVVNYITKSVSIFTVLKNMIGGSDYMARKGIGLIHTVEGVGFALDADVDVMRIAARGLPQHVRTYFQTMDTQKVLRRKLPCIGGCFATALDGCFGSLDAALKEPYTNNHTNTGVLFYPQKTVTEFVKTANCAGLQIAMHAIGDAAVEQALNAYETALTDFPRKDHRHVIIHADLMNNAMIERAAKLQLGIALQTPFLDWAQEPLEYLESILGERLQYLIPVKSMIDAGIMVANGSDGPCTLPDPIFGIHAACNHPNSDQRISPLDALKTVTNWAAKFSFDENERGTLTVGKSADFVVLDQELLSIPVEKIKDTQIKALYLSGQPYSGQTDSAVNLLMKSIKNKLFA